MLALKKKQQKSTNTSEREEKGKITKKQLLSMRDITPNDPLKSKEDQKAAGSKFKSTQ